MIKAGSLFYAIVISILMAIISGMCILSFYFSDIEFQSCEMIQRLNVNATSGLNLLLDDRSVTEMNEGVILDLFGKGTDWVELKTIPWGAFEIAIAKAKSKSNFSSRIAMTGHPIDELNLYSIYLMDENKPLAVSGKTVIRGNAFLPSLGIKRAYIEGQSYQGSELVYGQIMNSKKTLPEFNKQQLDNIQEMFSEKRITNSDSVIETASELGGDSIVNSFEKNTMVFMSKEKLTISSGLYSGNIAVFSDREVLIESDAVMRDVIICAPKVRIKENFKGNVQVFSSDSITIEKNVSLNYPSVLGLISNDKSSKVSSIQIGENDTIKGTVFSYQKIEAPLKQMNIELGKKSVVMGQVQTNGSVDLKGCIYGSLMCRKIMLRTSSSVYENHLLDATIDITRLSEHYVGADFISFDSPKKVIKWLN